MFIGMRKGGVSNTLTRMGEWRVDYIITGAGMFQSSLKCHRVPRGKDSQKLESEHDLCPGPNHGQYAPNGKRGGNRGNVIHCKRMRLNRNVRQQLALAVKAKFELSLFNCSIHD